jgi:hypothetical protein
MCIGSWAKNFLPVRGGGVYFYVPRGMVGHGLKLGAPTWGRQCGVAWEYFLDFYMGRNVFRPCGLGILFHCSTWNGWLCI